MEGHVAGYEKEVIHGRGHQQQAGLWMVGRKQAVMPEPSGIPRQPRIVLGVQIYAQIEVAQI